MNILKKIVIASIGVIILLLLVIITETRNRKKSYPLPPSDFTSQSKEIKVGMDEEEVLKSVTLYTDIRKEKGRIIFLLEPEPRKYFTAPTLYINVYIDDNNKVERVTVSDG